MKDYFEEQYAYYSEHFNIAADPISIPKQFSELQDIEISAFFAATLAWGNRTAILKSCRHLLSLMDNAPYDFVLNHTDADLKKLSEFYYRTFNGTDALYFLEFLKHHYAHHHSLESAFFPELYSKENVKEGLMYFNNYFFSLPYIPDRSRKHVGNVNKGSACKRLNMFLRWMVRVDNIDFGLWRNCQPSQLICPVDVHVGNVSRTLGLIDRKQNDWQTAELVTNKLKEFDSEDPVKYDLVLFSLGVEKRM